MAKGREALDLSVEGRLSRLETNVSWLKRISLATLAIVAAHVGVVGLQVLGVVLP